MQIIIASKNPVKINSVKNGFEKVFGNHDMTFSGINVPSEISDQPMNVDETYLGAQNRIKNAKHIHPKADFIVGIEGGLEVFEGQYYAFAWILINNGEIIGKARTGSFMLPPKITELIDQGMELGHADDIVFGQSNSKQKQGSVGILTNGAIDRTEYYNHAVVLALVPFLNKKLFLTTEDQSL